MSSEELLEQVKGELERIAALPANEQPAAYEALRAQLEAALEG